MTEIMFRQHQGTSLSLIVVRQDIVRLDTGIVEPLINTTPESDRNSTESQSTCTSKLQRSLQRSANKI